MGNKVAARAPGPENVTSPPWLARGTMTDRAQVAQIARRSFPAHHQGGPRRGGRGMRVCPPFLRSGPSVGGSASEADRSFATPCLFGKIYPRANTIEVRFSATSHATSYLARARIARCSAAIKSHRNRPRFRLGRRCAGGLMPGRRQPGAPRSSSTTPGTVEFLYDLDSTNGFSSKSIRASRLNIR